MGKYMNIDDKLQHFRELAMNSAMLKKASLVDDYKTGLDIQFENYKKDAFEKFEVQKKTKLESIKRENSKDFAMQQQHIRRKLTHKHDELKELLFNEVSEMLNNFFKTEDYLNLLVQEIKSSIDIAPSEEITIFIDPLDNDKKEYLETQTGVTVTISDYSFGRGMRAVIPSKNILVDNSFNYKINELKTDYTITF